MVELLQSALQGWSIASRCGIPAELLFLKVMARTALMGTKAVFKWGLRAELSQGNDNV